MSKRGERRKKAALFASITEMATGGGHDDAPIGDQVLAASPELSALVAPAGAKRQLPMMKKFRFQLLHRWIVENVAPGRVADIGGGKGLLAYLLQQSGWPATVIDPIWQSLPPKYKDLAADRQIKVAETEEVPRLSQPFAPELAKDFDLLVAMHAHGCNIQIIDAAAEEDQEFLLLPCCIIQEPIAPRPGQHWIQCVVEYATGRGFHLTPFRLNFKGQNIGLYGRRRPEAGKPRPG